MSDTVIKVDRLGKRYSLGQVHTNLLSERIGAGLRSFFSKIRRRDLSPFTSHLSPNEDFWALKDVSFEVKQGEVLGIIGRNGAGKSTLLKILSRITKPTEGRAEIYGRVGSLLEVGTGFHPELTGRENIFLNGAILGMSKAEIKKKFDDIVTFGEIEKFIDTPVKRYSSGMYVRLAFAVAAHLEPEILIIDEVLAVGDIQFQKKCLGKMDNVAKEGRTILFVSHNMGAVENLCKKSVWIDRGAIQDIGYSYDIIQQYLNSIREIKTEKRELLQGKEAVITSVECTDHEGRLSSAVCMGESISIDIHYEVAELVESLGFGISIEDQSGKRIFGINTMIEGKRSGPVHGRNTAYFRLPRVLLCPGIYYITVALHAPDGRVVDWIDNVAKFHVMAADMSGSGTFVSSSNGLVWLDHQWDI
jgi:lipopolysaccharide transport system ATP-binding protein